VRWPGRLLAGNLVEVQGSGKAFEGSKENTVVHAESREGNFSLHVQVSEFNAFGDAPYVGLMLREDGKAEGRMAAIALNKDRRPIAMYRAAAGAMKVKGSGLPYPPPNSWLGIQREGERLTLTASPDGQTFFKIGEVKMPGLARSLKVGVFASDACGRMSTLQATEKNKTAQNSSPSAAGAE
jgi:hypothetical protein